MYAEFLARYPLLVLAVITTISGICIIWSFVFHPLPDFADPTEGFETEGTEIANRVLSWEHLRAETGYLKTFYKYPHEGAIVSNSNGSQERRRRSRLQKRSDVNEDVWQQNITRMPAVFCREQMLSEQMTLLAHLVFESDNWLTKRSMDALCEYEKQVTTWLQDRWQLEPMCVTSETSRRRGRCCKWWHLAAYATAFAHKKRCDKLQNKDIAAFAVALSHCTPYATAYKHCAQRSVVEGSDMRQCLNTSEVELTCQQVELASAHLYLLERGVNVSSNGTYSGLTAVFLPYSQFEFAELAKRVSDFTQYLQPNANLANHIRLVGVQFGIRDVLFRSALLHDAMFGFLAIALVFTTIWLYTGTMWFTIVTMCGVLFSVCVAYFLYNIVFRISFFPYMNLLTVVLMVGIGADETFLCHRVWNSSKLEAKHRSRGLPLVVHDTFRHASLSMFLTGFTTACAAFANLLSDIVTLRCFGLFSGITVLVNYVFVVTWMPASLILLDRYTCTRFAGFGATGAHQRLGRLWGGSILRLIYSVFAAYDAVVDCGRITFEKLLPYFIVRFRWGWVIGLGSLAIGAVVVIFHKPGLRPPNSDYFKLLRPSHPCERYESELKHRFWFVQSSEQYPLPLRVIWGVKPVSSGNMLSPGGHGRLVVDDSFRFDSNLALLSLEQLCLDLVIANLTDFRIGQELFDPYCFTFAFRMWMQRSCSTDEFGHSSSMCCEKQFPYAAAQLVMEPCLYEVVSDFRRAFLPLYGADISTGPYFMNGTKKIGAIVIQFPSAFKFSFSYQDLHIFYETADAFIRRQLEKGPAPLRGGFFVSESNALRYYDLQRSLVSGTKASVGAALIIALAVVLCVTRNVCLSVLSIMCIGAVISVTVGALVMFGWELNVLEAIIIVLTVGLSFDYTLYFAVAYRECPPTVRDRESRVVHVLGSVGAPIFMSLVTTFLAGTAMLPARTMAFYQIGVFMMVVTVASWLYATCFFTSLLCMCGPVPVHCSAQTGSRGGTLLRTFCAYTFCFPTVVNGQMESQLRSGPGERRQRPEDCRATCNISVSRHGNRSNEQLQPPKNRSFKERAISSFRRAANMALVKRLTSDCNNGERHCPPEDDSHVSARSFFSDPDSQSLPFIDDEGKGFSGASGVNEAYERPGSDTTAS